MSKTTTKKSNRVTLKDIANKVGISTAAVSRSLKGSPDISEETRQKVIKAAKEMNYSTNYFANVLRTGKSKTLCILVPDNANPYNALLIKGIEETAKKKNYIVIFMNTNENEEDERQAIHTAISLQVDGILAVPVQPENYRNLTLPCILMAREFDTAQLDDVSFVINNDKKIIELATTHLLERYHDRPIYFVGGPKELLPTKIRLNAFQEILKSQNRQFKSDMALYTENTSRGGFLAAEQLIKEKKPPYSLVCLGSYIAIGVLKALRNHQVSIPDQVGIVSCDDIEITEYLEIPLTSVHHARYTIGSKAAEYIINSLEAEKSYGELLKVVLQPELIIRQST